MTFTTYTPAEFAASFPRARADERAVRYLSIEHNPRDFSEVEAAAASTVCGDLSVIKIGYTNKSRSKTTSRYAIIPA